MKKLYFLIALVSMLASSAMAQVAVNTDGSLPDPSAGLDVKFNIKGLLPPRMTFAERNSILNPAEGLTVFCTNCNTDGTAVLSTFQGGHWRDISKGCPSPISSCSYPIQVVTQFIWNRQNAPITFVLKGKQCMITLHWNARILFFDAYV